MCRAIDAAHPPTEIAMTRGSKRKLLLGGFAVAASVATLASAAGAAFVPSITNVPNANTKQAGMTRPDKLSPELTKHVVAQGNMAIENPSGANGFYGYDTPGPFVPAPGTTLEAQKTEPDKNTYLVLRGQKGADPNYDYGTHFLFQGHETGSPGYITRVNLDADVDHRVTLLANSDVTGATAADKSRIPNSFVYRFLPTNKADLTQGGKLQVLQLEDLAGGAFDASTFSQDMKDLHTYGNSFATSWVTIHDTAVDGTAPFDANAAAKAKGGTPFKRPENGVFRPGTGFREFYFDETGDTNALSPANVDYGGWGSLFAYKTNGPASNTGTLSIVLKGNQAHAGFDNMAFLSRDDLAVVEDAGDTLHTQRNALDSAYDFDVTHNYVDGAQPVRFLAQGRDASATIDSGISSLSPVPPDLHNEGDNEITGIHVSDGDASVFGILGGKVPVAFESFGRWRTFYTGQHGDNITWQIVRRPFTFRPSDEERDN
jgi:Alkaline phosphatase PhoX